MHNVERAVEVGFIAVVYAPNPKVRGKGAVNLVEVVQVRDEDSRPVVAGKCGGTQRKKQSRRYGKHFFVFRFHIFFLETFCFRICGLIPRNQICFFPSLERARRFAIS